MPLLSPTQIKSVLKETGVKDTNEIQKILALNGLSPDEVIQEVGYIMRGGDNSNIKLRAAETALKLNGLLRNDNEGPSAPIVNIIINDSEFNLNPILIPRE